MDNIIEDNKKLLKKLTDIKNRMIDIHIESTSGNSIETMTEISKLSEVNDDLKAMFILLHTNNVTATKFASESMIKNYNILIDITAESVSKQNELIVKVLEMDKSKNVLKTVLTKSKDYIVDTKYEILTITMGSIFVLWTMYMIAPIETEYVLTKVSEIIKKIL